MIHEEPRLHRKQWEYCFVLQALEVAGEMRLGSRGLGFGVGSEPLPAVFATRGCQVLATDLPIAGAVEAGWAKTGDYVARLEALNDRHICDPEIFQSRVDFRDLDMRNIPNDLRSFDFCWSSCALEHLGTIEAGLDFIVRSLETLRPGGVAVHTTELNCESDTKTLSEGGTVLFRISDLRRLANQLRAQGHTIKLNFHMGDGPVDRYVDQPPYAASPHLKIKLQQFVTTSFGLIVRKADPWGNQPLTAYEREPPQAIVDQVPESYRLRSAIDRFETKVAQSHSLVQEVQGDLQSGLADVRSQFEGHVSRLGSQIDNLTAELNSEPRKSAISNAITQSHSLVQEVQGDLQSGLAEVRSQFEGHVSRLGSQIENLTAELNSEHRKGAISNAIAPLADASGHGRVEYFDIWRLLKEPREVNEAMIRGLCRTSFLGDHTSLCRVLGRYKMFVDTRDIGIASHLLLDGFWEMWVTEEMLRHVRQGMTVLDIGANLGYFSLLLADLTGPKGRVIAFEPNPLMSSLARRSIEVNGFAPWTTLHEVALGGENGEAALSVVASHPGGAHILKTGAQDTSIKIPVRRLDEIEGALDADFIKMDVEGFEEHVWRGMKALLARKRALTIFMEFNISRFSDAKVFLDEILSHGFSLGIVDFQAGTRPTTREELFGQSHTIDHMLVFQRSG